MRKVLVVLMLVCVFGLFAQIPAGTKSIVLLTGGTGDLLNDDGFLYGINLNAGYFIIDALEIDAIFGFVGSTYEDVEANFTLGLGAFYHFPINPMFGLYGGAEFDAWIVTGGNVMDISIDTGLELFLTKNNAIRIANRFTFSLEEGMENTDGIILGMVHYLL